MENNSNIIKFRRMTLEKVENPERGGMYYFYDHEMKKMFGPARLGRYYNPTTPGLTPSYCEFAGYKWRYLREITMYRKIANAGMPAPEPVPEPVDNVQVPLYNDDNQSATTEEVAESVCSLQKKQYRVLKVREVDTVEVGNTYYYGYRNSDYPYPAGPYECTGSVDGMYFFKVGAYTPSVVLNAKDVVMYTVVDSVFEFE